MRTVLLTAINTKDNSFVCAAVDCEEFTPATWTALVNLSLKRIAARMSPTAQKIADQSSGEMFDYLLEHGWRFEIKEQPNEARIVAETPIKEKGNGKKD